MLLLASAVIVEDPRLGGPVTYSTPTPDGKHLFVMIAPRPTNPHPAHLPEKTEHEQALYAKYASSGSGLYRNDGSTQPLWSVDWYSYRVFPANDAVHLVRVHGDFPLTDKFPASKRLGEDAVAEQASAPALSFYANGDLLKTYSVVDLVRNIEGLPHSLYHVMWFSDGVITREGDRFGLTTQEPRQIYFNLADGSIAIDRGAGLGNAQIWVVRISIAITGIAAIVILVLWLFFQKRESAGDPPPVK